MEVEKALQNELDKVLEEDNHDDKFEKKFERLLRQEKNGIKTDIDKIKLIKEHVAETLNRFKE